MGRVNIGKGIRFLLHDRLYEIKEELFGNQYVAKDLSFGVERNFTLNDLLTFLNNGDLRFEEMGVNTIEEDGIKKYEFEDFTLLSDNLKNGARFRLYVIKPLIGIEGESLNQYINERIKQLKKEGHDVSRASIYRWLKQYQGDIRSLVSSYQNCGSNSKRLDRKVEVIIDQIIDKHYLVRESTTVTTIYELVYHRIVQENKFREDDDKLGIPSVSTISRRIKEKDIFETEKARNGKFSAFGKYGQVQPGKKGTRPLERVECDHSRLDLFVVDDENRLPIGRPYITSLLDTFTGYPLGVYIGFEPPSYSTVMHCLKHAISPKSYVKQKYPDIENDWYAYGLPELLVVDNGKEFHSQDLKDTCEQLGIELYHCPVKTPWYKGAVERHFRTINQELIHQMPGTSFSNILAKKDYDPQKNAIITFSTLLHIFHKWLLDSYAEKNHKGIGGVPKKLWQEFTKVCIPAVPAFKKDWEIILGKVSTGSIQRYGIRHLHLNYQSPELSRINQHLLKLPKHQRQVKFKYDPDDLSKIYVYDEFEKKGYVEVLCTNQEYSKNLNLYTHRVIIKKALENSKEVNMELIARTKAEIMDLVRSEWKESKNLKERQKAARIKGIGTNQAFKDVSTENKDDSSGKALDNVKKKDNKDIKDQHFAILGEKDEWGAFSAKKSNFG